MTRREAERYRRHINGLITELPDNAALDVTECGSRDRPICFGRRLSNGDG